MITVKCNRCASEIDPKGEIGYMSWCFKQGVDGDLGENELEGMHFCERCMDEVMTTIRRPVEWGKQKMEYETPVIEEIKAKEKKGRKSKISKEKGEAIRELKERGFTIKGIAEELEMDPVQVKNWLYYHKEKE